eukprot:s1007_g31.t1
MTSGFRAVEALMINNFGYTIQESKAADTRIYMDDRTFVDSDLNRALDRVTAWTSWSSSVGLQEDQNKVQALAKTKAVQNQLQARQPVWTQDRTLSALGVSIRAGPVANTNLEESRIQTATQRTKLLACLPLSYNHKMDLYRIFVVPKATYGWINRFPPEATANRLFNALTKMTNTNKMANPCIRATLYGGNSHSHPVIASRMFKRLAKMRRYIPWTNQAGSPVKALRDWMQKIGWCEICPWKWRWYNVVVEAGASTGADTMHHLRHVWRMHLLTKFSRSKRHEAAEWRRNTTPAQMRANFDEVDLQGARRFFTNASPATRAVLLGSVVSPSWYGRAHNTSTKCPWCRCAGTWMHLAWHCRSIPGAAEKRPRHLPSNWLTRRFGWPTTSDSFIASSRRLQWLSEVVELIWQLRHD